MVSCYAHDMKRIAIMGTGMVGGALDRYFKTLNIEAGLYDPPKGLHDISLLEKADVIFVAVPTPYYLDGTGFDDSYLHEAIKTISSIEKTIVLKSTILPGTTDDFQTRYPEHRFLFNPEFLTETRADHDMQYPTRQIIGYTEASRKDAELVMDMLPDAPFKKIIPAKEAEFIKYFGNAFYALKVAYANQMYDLAKHMGLNYELIAECAKPEPMIGETHLDIFHKGYRGYGGKCLPKDTRAIIQLAKRLNLDLTLLQEAEQYNNALCRDQGLSIEWYEGSPKKEA